MDGPRPAVFLARRADDVGLNLETWARSLRHKSPATVKSYTSAGKLFYEYLKRQGMPLQVRNLTREHVEDWLDHLMTTHQRSTVATRHQILEQFFKYLLEEGEITRHPMERIKAPTFRNKPVGIISSDDFGRMIEACSGRNYTDIRDKTILMMLMDTGMRRAEIAGLSLDDIEFEPRRIKVTGKGNKIRNVTYSPDFGDQLDRYLRARQRWLDEPRRAHAIRESRDVWFGENGRFTHYGINYSVRRRAIAAGLVDAQGKPTVHVHKFRHAATHYLLMSGMDPGAVQVQMGWETQDQLARYGRAGAEVRARDSYDRHSPLRQMRKR